MVLDWAFRPPLCLEIRTTLSYCFTSVNFYLTLDSFMPQCTSFLLTLNLLAFLFHTVLELVDAKYHLLRQTLVTRQTFFNDIKTLTRYLYFESWQHLLHFMIKQLELDPAFDTS